jgi:hypothetical protein
MTSATTMLALIPILASTGRGSDIMVPMAIPSFGGMFVVFISVFIIPVLYCMNKEFAFDRRKGKEKAVAAYEKYATPSSLTPSKSSPIQ